MSEYELQEVLLFWICAAGKNAMTAARGLDGALNEAFSRLPKRWQKDAKPFDALKHVDDLPSLLKSHGIGCYNQKARTMKELIEADLNLKKCSVDDLEKITGIGPKTARCFIMHSRRNARCAGLDTHILHYLRDEGYDVPDSTPGSKRKYLELEQVFLELADASGKSVAAFDLEVWNRYRQGRRDAVRSVGINTRSADKISGDRKSNPHRRRLLPNSLQPSN